MPYRAQFDNAFAGGDLLQRATLACVTAALSIYAENPATSGHALRAALATKVLNDPAGYAAKFLYVCALGAQTTDAGCETSIAAAWNCMAGA